MKPEVSEPDGNRLTTGNLQIVTLADESDPENLQSVTVARERHGVQVFGRRPGAECHAVQVFPPVTSSWPPRRPRSVSRVESDGVQALERRARVKCRCTALLGRRCALLDLREVAAPAHSSDQVKPVFY
jgi:hypothetical protein